MLYRLLLATALLIPRAAAAQHTAEIRLIRASDGSAYRFSPVEVTARPGEIIDFQVESGGPYLLAFEAADLTPSARRLLAGALGDPAGSLRAPTLSGPGQHFRLAVPALPPGTYRFRSLTHVAYRMEGRLVIRAGGSSRPPT